MSSDLQSELMPALQSALVNFDGLKVASLIEQGLTVRRAYVDPHKYRNALHELVLNYVAYSANERTPKLHINFIDIMNLLMQNGLDINEVDIKHQTVLHHACSSPDHPEIIRALLTSGVQVNRPDCGQQTALHKAVIAGSRLDVEALLEAKADPNLFDNMGHSALHLAVKRKNNGEMLKFLVGCGANVNLNHPEWNKYSRGATPLHLAARLGRIENAKVLLKLGAEPNTVDASGQTALHVAAASELTGKLCTLLIQQGAKEDLRDQLSGEIPLHKAVKANMVENVQVLLHSHSSPLMTDHSKETSLHKAAIYCTDMTIWRLLLPRSIPKTPTSINGEAPPTVASYMSVNNDGHTPLEKAQKAKNSTAIALLKAQDI